MTSTLMQGLKLSLITAILLSAIPFLLGVAANSIPYVGSYIAGIVFSFTLIIFATFFIVTFVIFYIMKYLFKNPTALEFALLSGAAEFIASGFDIPAGIYAAFGGFIAYKLSQMRL